MNRLRYILVLILGSWLLTQNLSAETIIVGHVFDSKTGEDIVNANVTVRGTQIGCATNNEGLFMIRAEIEKKRTLVISALGYKTQRYTIEPNQNAGIEVEMIEQTELLSEVFVRPGENPALAIMDQVRAHAATNDITRDEETAAHYTQNTELFISNIQQRHLQRQLWKSLQQGMLLEEDSTYLLPLYHLQEEYISRGETTEDSQPKKEESLFLTETDYQILLNGIPRTLNFYRNTLDIFGKQFVSPLASFSNQYYAYYLQEENEEDSTQVTIRFKTKNPFIPSFNGEMVIDTTTFALQTIQVTVPHEVNVNYLSSLQLQQHYTPNKTLANEHLSMLFDFAIKADTTKFFPTILLKKNIQGEIATSTTASSNSELQPIIDSTQKEILDSIPLVKWARWFAYMLHTGEIRMGKAKVNVGNIVHIIGGSSTEGLRLGVPLATNEQLWKNVRLNGYFAYGFRDKTPKWLAEIQVKLPTKRRHIIGTHYWDRFVDTDISNIDIALRENSILTGEMDFSYRLLRGVHSSYIAEQEGARRREFKVFSKNEWSDIVETDLSFQMGKMDLVQNNVWGESYTYRSLNAGVRLGWQERKIDMHFRRHYLHSTYPVVRAFAEFGSYQFTDTNQESLYGKLAVTVQQNVPLGVAGHLDYTTEAGIIIGDVPYPMLKTFAGNQSWVFDSYRFSLMPLNQQQVDKYILLHAHWNGEGILFNRIPGIRYLRWHELFALKIAWGGNSQRNIINTEQPNIPIPYLETAIGIGNVLRVGDFYFVSRLTNFKDTTAPIMGFRFRFRLGI